jgi:hypothetical protein
MRALIIGTLLLLFGVQEQMVAPKVERKKRTETQVYEEVTRSCPAGYEGHFVDTRTGFGPEYWWGEQGFFISAYGGELGYTVCFKKEFMDEIRKNPELIAERPLPPKPV